MKLLAMYLLLEPSEAFFTDTHGMLPAALPDIENYYVILAKSIFLFTTYNLTFNVQ